MKGHPMRKISVIVAGLAGLIGVPAAAHGASMVESSTYRPTATNVYFSSLAEDTPQFQTRYVQLPADVSAGDIVLVNGREEFSNPSWDSQGAWLVNGVRSEHWSTPIMGACGMKTTSSPGVVTAGSWISQQVAENFDGVQHHWVYDASEAYTATAGDAGDWVAIQCYFSRAVAYRDIDADYVQTHPTYGRVEAVVIS